MFCNHPMIYPSGLGTYRSSPSYGSLCARTKFMGLSQGTTKVYVIIFKLDCTTTSYLWNMERIHHTTPVTGPAESRICEKCWSNAHQCSSYLTTSIGAQEFVHIPVINLVRHRGCLSLTICRSIGGSVFNHSACQPPATWQTYTN